MSIMNKLKSNSKLKKASVLAESEFFADFEFTSMDVPMLNVALSGSLNGGLSHGLTVLAGESKHFKTSFALKMASEYLKKHNDAVILFYDSEFGAPQSYFKNFEIDLNRVLHVPILDMEELKFDMVSQLENLDKNDKVIIIIDSLGNLASKKELTDVRDTKSVSDMTRAKELKAVFRMVTPLLTTKQVPVLAINHVYDEMSGGPYKKKIVSGGTGLYYSANNVWIIGRRQDKDGNDIVGYEFVINIDKSRFVKEKTKIPISVTWEGGIERYSGLLEVALAGGFVAKPSNGWYQKVDIETGEMIGNKFREKDTLTESFWSDILVSPKFQSYIEKKYMIDKIDDFDSTEGELDVFSEDE
jgi:RecA/RadA recombinase